jgi:hypothetical protein
VNRIQGLRDKIEEALWMNAEGKDYYNAPLSIRREILDIAMPIIESEMCALLTDHMGES